MPAVLATGSINPSALNKTKKRKRYIKNFKQKAIDVLPTDTDLNKVDVWFVVFFVYLLPWSVGEWFKSVHFLVDRHQTFIAVVIHFHYMKIHRL
jgi:hypothetical protein